MTKSYCVNCDEVTSYKLDEAKRWECRACGFGVECVECGLQMSANHNCAREIAAMGGEVAS